MVRLLREVRRLCNMLRNIFVVLLHYFLTSKTAVIGSSQIVYMSASESRLGVISGGEISFGELLFKLNLFLQ